MLAGYTISTLAFIIKDARTLVDSSGRVNAVYAAMVILLPLTLVAVLAAAIRAKAHHMVFSNFEDFKRFLLLCESMFATYVGMFVYSLFDRKAPVGVVGAAAPTKALPQEPPRLRRSGRG